MRSVTAAGVLLGKVSPMGRRDRDVTRMVLLLMAEEYGRRVSRVAFSRLMWYMVAFVMPALDLLVTVGDMDARVGMRNRVPPQPTLQPGVLRKQVNCR